MVLLGGVVKSFNADERRLNKIVVSFYLLVYHVCFFGFWAVEDTRNHPMFAIMALLVLIIGALHEALELLLFSAL